jgi:hypothetical protein
MVEVKMTHPILKTVNIKSVLVLIFLCFSLLTGCQTQELKTNWSSTPIKVDGKMNDWANTPMAYFEENGVQLGLRNDSENLYILFRFNNQAYAQAIRLGGLTIWFDNSGKKKKELGVRYTGGPSFLHFQKMKSVQGGGFEESLTEEQKERLGEREKSMIMRDQMVAVGKKGSQERILSTDGSDGPAVSFDSSQGAFTYEFSLPLQKSDFSRYGINDRPGGILSLGFEWGGVTMPDRKSGGGNPPGGMGGEPPDGGMGGGPPGGMGSGPPGGMGGGPPGGRGGGRENGPGGSSNKVSEKQEIWLKTNLASPTVE